MRIIKWNLVLSYQFNGKESGTNRIVTSLEAAILNIIYKKKIREQNTHY